MAIEINGAGTITGLNATGISAQPVFPGNVLQVVSATKTDTFSTSSTSFTAVTGLSASITPTSASSKILIVGNLVIGHEQDGAIHFRISGGNATDYVGDAAGSRIRAIGGGTFTTTGAGLNPRTLAYSMALNYLDLPNTTGALTYQVEIVRGGTAGTAYVNRTAIDTDNSFYPRGASTITLMEIAG